MENLEKLMNDLEESLMSKIPESRLSFSDQLKKFTDKIDDLEMRESQLSFPDQLKKTTDKIDDLEVAKAKEISSLAMEEPVKEKIRIVMLSKSLEAVNEVCSWLKIVHGSWHNDFRDQRSHLSNLPCY